MSQTTIPVIIPYFRAPEQLDRCIQALKGGAYPAIEIFIRDNSDDNILFTKAVNEGLIKYLFDPAIDYALILNQDAYVLPDMLTRLVDHMDAHPRCGIACPLQIDGGQVTWGGSFEAFPWGRHRQDPLASYTAPFETPWAHGAAMLVRMSMLRETGLLDHNMRFVFSDADLSYTARARGWQVTVVPLARVEHVVSTSALGGPPELNIVKIQDALYFAEKWISADLFRRLEFQGENLKGQVARFEIDRFRAILKNAM